MKIEEGGYYKTRDGRKVGPIRNNEHFNDGFPFDTTGSRGFWSESGVSQCKSDPDLVAVWAEEGPVRLVTRQVVKDVTRPEIQDGEFGRIRVLPLTGGAVGLRFTSPDSANLASLNSAELTAAIATLTTIRDALDEVA